MEETSNDLMSLTANLNICESSEEVLVGQFPPSHYGSYFPASSHAVIFDVAVSVE